MKTGLAALLLVVLCAAAVRAHHLVRGGIRRRGDRRQPWRLRPLRVASLGMGWWSDVLADAINRSGKLKITARYSRSEEKRAAFRRKIWLPRGAELRGHPATTRNIEAVINTTPNGVHLETTARGGRCRQACLSRQTHRQHGFGRPQDHRDLPQGGVVARPWAINAAGRASSAGSSARSTKDYSASWSNAESQHQPRSSRQDRPGFVALPGRRNAGRRRCSRSASTTPTFWNILMGPVKAVSGAIRAAGAAGRQPGRGEPACWSTRMARYRRSMPAYASAS